MPREESDLTPVTPLTRRVALTAEVQGGGSIAALIPGPNCRISDAWVQIGNERVTEVPVNEPFSIWCTYIAENVAKDAMFDYTKSCVTCKGDGVKRYTHHTFMGTTYTKTTKLDQYAGGTVADPVMPAGSGPLSLRLKLWLNDEAYISPPYPTDENLW